MYVLFDNIFASLMTHACVGSDHIFIFLELLKVEAPGEIGIAMKFLEDDSDEQVCHLLRYVVYRSGSMDL
jgi:predicted permease